MSQIPPTIVVSGLGAAYASQHQSSVQQADEASAADARSRETRTINESGETVDATDEDMAVFSDSAGMGSQGRSDEDPQSPDESPNTPENADAAPPATGLDIRA